MRRFGALAWRVDLLGGIGRADEVVAGETRRRFNGGGLNDAGRELIAAVDANARLAVNMPS